MLVRGLIACCGLVVLGGAGPLPKLPSGQPVSLQEVIWPKQDAVAGERAARFRFVAPKLKKGANADADLAALCTQVALPMMKERAVSLEQVVISMASKPVAVGEARPDVAQVFEAFGVSDGRCVEALPW